MAVTANTVRFRQNYGEFVKSHLIKKSFSSALFSCMVINLPNWTIWIEFYQNILHNNLKLESTKMYNLN